MLITDQVATAPCTDRVQLCFGLLGKASRSNSDEDSYCLRRFRFGQYCD